MGKSGQLKNKPPKDPPVSQGRVQGDTSISSEIDPITTSQAKRAPKKDRP